MLDPSHPLAELLARDQRFHFDAYVFVFDALGYAQKGLKSDSGRTSESEVELEEFAGLEEQAGEHGSSQGASSQGEPGKELSHVTGQQLCEAIRRYAIQQYGLLAKSVLNHWGIQSTDDFGEIVFNLIDIGQMRKNATDCREDFAQVFDFESGLSDPFVLTPTDSSEERRP